MFSYDTEGLETSHRQPVVSQVDQQVASEVEA